jgi:hypothetical protein
MGYDAEVEEITVPPEAHPWAIENPIYDEDASKMAGVPVFKGKKILEGVNYSGGGTALAVKTITPNGSYGGGIGVNTTTESPKSGGKSKKPQRTHQSETVERYKEVTDKIDDTTDAIEDARRAADGLWGPARIKKMREVQKEMKKEIGLLREKKVEAENYLRKD